MAELPEASVTIDDEAGAFAGATGYAIVLAAVAQNDDCVPRVYSSVKGILDQHGYSQGADYAALHIEKTRKPIIFVGMPIGTAGTAGRIDSSGVAGSSAITVASGADGYLEEIDGRIEVVTGGTIGVTGIVLDVSADGGRSTKRVRLLTATSYTFPHIGVVVQFGGGTLIAGDVFTFSTTAPLWDQAGLTAARTALAAQLKLARSFVVIGDLPNSTYAGYVVTEVNAYETSNERDVVARVQVRDRTPLASGSKSSHTMNGDPVLTFDAAGDTVTRATGSWLDDGFAVGDVVTFASTTSNNLSAEILTLTATEMGLGNVVTDEGPTSGHTCIGSDGYVFDSATHTITRSGGSWFADGFRVGDSVTTTGTASNNFTKTITVLTSTVMTFASGVVDETIGSHNVTIGAGETMSAWVAACDAAFATIDSQKRIDLGLGRARKQSPITGWLFRRPAAWGASVREYEHDVHIPTFRKADGPLDEWSLEDEDGNVVEFDERTVGGALAARFTCFRTYANGPRGTFVALSLTRAPESSLLSRTHNMMVANLACTIARAETENAIGQVLVLNANGTGKESSLALIEERVNSSLQINLLQDKGEGQRASSAKWTANRNSVLNVPGAELLGQLDLLLDGTLEKITTRVRIQTAG